MKRITLLVALSVITLLFHSCGKDSCDPVPPDAEATQILAFASDNGMNVTSHPSGLYYEIIDPGSGATPDINSKVKVTYTGKLLDGTIIDESTTPNDPGIPLSSFIEGWRLGLPFIKESGTIHLLIPSALAYGCEPYRGLPGNSILFFEVNLIDVE